MDLREDNRIIIEPCAGLGNRLLAMTSAYELSRRLGKELMVVWKREVGCAIRAEDLFEMSVPVVEISEMGWKNGVLDNLKSNGLRKKYRGMADRFFECDEIADAKSAGGFEKVKLMVAQEPVSYIKSYTNLCEIGEESFSFLKPGKEVLKRGDRVFSRISEKTVGVHIRRTDHVEAIKNSPLALFVEKMQAEAAGQDTDFYVTTDDASAIEELKQYFPAEKLIVYEEKVLDRDSKAGIQDALVDMLCLSKCRKILGSYQSTFSLIPSIMGNIELEYCVKQP